MSNPMTSETAISTLDIKIGDRFNYNPIGKVYTIPGKLLGTGEDVTFATEKLGWRIDVIDKRLCLVSESVTSQKLNLRYVKDKNLAIQLLNRIAKECYTDPEVALEVRCINEPMFKKLKDVNRPVREDEAYWLSTIYWKECEDTYRNFIRWVNNKQWICSCKMSVADDIVNYNCELPIRVVVFLKPGLRFSKIRLEDGKKVLRVKR